MDSSDTPASASATPDERNLSRALRLSERTADITAAAATPQEAALPLLTELCAFLDWPVGRVWFMPVSGVLSPAASWYTSDPERFRVLRQVFATSSPPSVADGTSSSAATSGPVGRVMATGLPAWSLDVGDAAAEAGLAVSLALPVCQGADVVAVVELLGEGESAPDAGDVQSLARAVLQFGRVIDRQRAMATDTDRRHLLDATHDAFFRLDHDLVVIDWNPRAGVSFGWPSVDAIGQPLVDLIAPSRFRAPLSDALHKARDHPGAVTIELTARHRSGAEFPIELAVWSSGPGQDPGVSGLAADLGGQRRLEGQLARQALHDRLTGLPNRALFRDRLDHALARSLRDGSSLAVLLFDLDRFKVVNDSLGPGGGDRLLMAVGDRLAGIERPGDTVARLGGDEYALLCENVTDAEAAALAQTVLDAFRAPFDVNGDEVTISASLGVAVVTAEAPFSPAQGDLLMRDADVAMYRAKQRGRGRFEVFLEAMRTEAAGRLSMENDLRHAIRQGQLRLFYQPIVRLDTARVVGFEALVRWEHPTKGLLTPADFIPPAEETGLIVPLGRLVLAEATLQAAAWQRRRDPRDEPLRMSVNVSARQLSQPGWVDEVADLLASSSLEPELLVLEITESVLMDDIEASIERLEELRRLGVRIAIDDFGTGYSSLGYLRRLPVDVLKIDKTFIDGVAEGPHESALARAVIKLASTLGLDAVAEGVSDKRQLTKLQRLHCPYGQGYYFSEPQPAEKAGALLDLPSLPGAD